MNLSITQRILAVFIYVAIFTFSCHYFSNNWDFLVDPKDKYNLLFVSGALLLIFGSYIAEPFFTKPVDVITNSTAVILALLSIDSPENFVGYKFLFVSACVLLILSILVIFLSKFQKIERFQKVLFEILTKVGQSKVSFSFIYIFTIFSYFRDTHIEFAFFLTFWIILITQFFVEGLLLWASKVLDYILNSKKYSEILGQAIGCENPLLYKVEIDYTKHSARPVKYGDLVALETSVNVGSIGMVVDTKYLLNKRWLSIYLLQDSSGDVLKINLKDKKLVTEPKSIFAKENLVYLLDFSNLNDDLLKAKIFGCPLYKDMEQFVGYVASGSNINTLNFSILRGVNKLEQEISEGAILKTLIYGRETLYQVINGNSKEEHLENFDRHGFIIGIARKLGRYKADTKELDVSKWMPSIFSPLFYAFSGSVSEERIKEIAQYSIGRLPDTDLEIPIKDMSAMVTHNTAILGILGIGKSCLAYELMKRAAEEKIKVVCIDITNEYKKELPVYLPATTAITSDDENAFNVINTKYEYIHTDGNKQNPEKSGNLNEYKEVIRKDLCQFLFSADNVPESKEFETTKQVRIYNVDYHKASRGEKIGFNVNTTDLTQAEKTRIIAEELFKILMKIPLADEKKAKVLLVFEEAHSLIPEWNSVASEGDKSATNGTAKVILQGRKYGLGSLVITQRTANVSKSILNQCNTIFALRVFDDTGKGFLENYIGADYADTLATLEERHAIAIGKGLKLKQPVIIQLNDRKNVIPVSQNEA